MDLASAEGLQTPTSRSTTGTGCVTPGENKSDNGHDKSVITSRSHIPNARRIVVKVGSAVLTREDGCGLALGRVASLVEQVSTLTNAGREIIMVTSGAVAIGKQILSQELGLPVKHSPNSKNRSPNGNTTPLDPRTAAAVGQLDLVYTYKTMFAQYGVTIAQVLLTQANFADASARKLFFKTITELLSLNVVPIVNTNDAVEALQVYNELEGGITVNDNDSLAALISSEFQADLMILMSNVDGVLTSPPGTEGSRLLHTYCPSSTQSCIKFGPKSPVGCGGMQAKVSAATWALNNGTAVIICNGSKAGVLNEIIDGKRTGTLFTNYVNGAICHVDIAELAKEGGRKLANLTGAQRSEIIGRLGDLLVIRKEEILAANNIDLEKAKDRSSSAEYGRLKLTDAKISSLASGLEQIARDSANIVGRTVKRTLLADGLELEQITVPIGLLMVIFESRPDCLPQIAALSIASANGLILKGGSEAINSNTALMSIVSEALSLHGVQDAIQMVTSREDANEIIGLGMVDLIIPRGSSALVKSVTAQAQGVPVLGHSEGICNVFVDIDADLEKALRTVKDAKCSYPAACNAVETVLIHRQLLSQEKFLAGLCDMLKSNNVEIFYGPNLHKEFPCGPPLAKTLRTEYGRLACTLEVVSDISEAIDHIHSYGSSHTDAIITENERAATEFLRRVDSACVFHNASTRFADGYRFGLGAEVGISTGRIHARGPVGIEGLLTTKWILRGQGDASTDFGPGGRTYEHLQLPIDDKVSPAP